MEIPYKSLEADTLRALIEDFVTRDGTDYGEREASLDSKIKDVMIQLHDGTISIAFDEKTESCGFIVKR